MYEFLTALGGCYQAWRASQDAGAWFLLFDQEARNHYLECLAITRKLL